MTRNRIPLLVLGSLVTTLTLPAVAVADDTGARILLKGQIGLGTKVTTGVSVAGDSATSRPFSVDDSQGFELEFTGRPIPYVAFGISTGMAFISKGQLNERVLDLNAVFKLILPLGQLSDRHLLELYAGVGGGLSLGLSELAMDQGLVLRPGWNINPHGGVLFNVSRHVALFFEAGYSLHNTRYACSFSCASASVKVSWNEVSLRSGIGFSF